MNTMRGVGVFPCDVVRVRRQCSRIHHHHSSSFQNNNNGRRIMKKCFVVRNSSSKLDNDGEDAEADVIVIGSGIGGLSCAALLARYEQDVILLESHDVAGGAAHSFDVKGYKFDSGPSLFSGLQSRGPQANPLAQVLDALGESVPCATYDSWMVYVPEADFLSRIGPTEFLKDLQNYAGPEAVREWQKLLVSSTSPFLSYLLTYYLLLLLLSLYMYLCASTGCCTSLVYSCNGSSPSICSRRFRCSLHCCC
jgi:hypothetical protein